jgi:hypothetical protein
MTRAGLEPATYELKGRMFIVVLASSRIGTLRWRAGWLEAMIVENQLESREIG